MNMLKKGLLLLVLSVFAAGIVNAASLENGMVLNVEGAPGYYIYVNGYASPIPSPEVYQCMGLWKKKTRNVKISKQQLDSMPKTAFLIRGSDRKVYRVDGSTRRLVPNAQVFKKLAFNEREIIEVADNTINCIKEGPPLH